MTAPRSFLMALAQVLSYRRLYGPIHPVSREAMATAVDRADFLLSEARHPVFEFQADGVLCEGRPVRDPGPVGWADRLRGAGIGRIEVRELPDAAQMDLFLREIEARLDAAAKAPSTGPVEETRAGAEGTVLVLPVGGGGAAANPVRAPTSASPRPGAAGAPGPDVDDSGHPDLGAELACVSWVWSEVEAGRALPVAEAEAVVRSLGVLLRDLPPRSAPRVRVADGWDYGPLHAMHTALLAMAWVKDAGVTPRELLEFGLAGLFHDVGLVVSAPGGRLDHAGSLDEDERALVEAHPVEGARLLLASDARLSLAAVVAFEHHLLPGGGGYPAASLVGEPHVAARVIQVLSSYDALRSTRPHRLARSPEATREVVRSGGGRIFDAAFVQAFERFDPEVAAVASRAAPSTRDAGRASP
jgi:HD-GYP domain-containing protein (c-di-GMP phosphodiesterase class II)